MTDFFSINLPYTLKKLTNERWIVLNRESELLGHVNSAPESDRWQQDISLCHTYYGLTEEVLEELGRQAHGAPGVCRDDSNSIVQIYLYNDSTNPVGRYRTNKHWRDYCRKLQILSILRNANGVSAIDFRRRRKIGTHSGHSDRANP